MGYLTKTAAGLLSLLIMGAAFAQPAAIELNYQLPKQKMSAPNWPLVADLVGGPVPELLVTDVRGKMRLYNALTGKEIETVTFGSEALTAPGLGDFTGDSAHEIVIGTGSGRLVVLSGSSFRIIDQQSVGQNFSIQPTTVPMIRPDGSSRDRIVIVDGDGIIRAFDLNQQGKLEEKWSYSTGSRVLSPLSLGSPRRDNTTPGSLDVIAATSDGHVIIIDPTSGEADKVLIGQRMSFSVSATLADPNARRFDDIFIFQDDGTLRCMRYDGTSHPRLKSAWSFVAGGRPTSAPVLVHRGGDTFNSYLLLTTQNSIHAIGTKDGALAAEDRTRFEGITTHPALIPRPSGFPEIAFGIGRTMQVTQDFEQWISGGGNSRLSTMQADLRHPLRGPIVVALGDEREGAVVIGISPDEEGNIYSFRTPYAIPAEVWPTRTPWMTLGGSPYHASMLDREWARLEQGRREKRALAIAAWEQDLDAAMADAEWQQALELASHLIEHNPYDSSYRSLSRTVFLKKNMIAIVIGVIIFLGLMVFAAWQSFKFMTNRNLRKRAETSYSRGDYEQARRFYQRLLARLPRNQRVGHALAKVYVAQRDFSEETLPVYEMAHDAQPDDQELLHSYARALLLEPKTTIKAAQVYERALPSFPEPQLLEYGLGRCAFVSGNFDEAGKRLRAALRGGVTTDALYRSLCDVYVKTQNYTAKALPVFEQQFPSRMNDKEFLEAYLASCIDAKKSDPQVESLCQSVLELSPNYMPAYLHLAMILLQKNQVGAAIEEVRQALVIEPRNVQAVTMLANCYLVQSRKDEEALQAYRRVLQINPAEKEILRTMTSIFFERGTFDEEAVSIYHRSIEENPNDVITLRALAQSAQLTSDHDLAIRSIEAINTLGQINQKLIMQLAQAYVKKQVVEPKAERVLRDALRIEPNNAEYLAAVSRVLCAQDRTEVDCIALFESHLSNYKDDLVVGRQLAKCYIKSDRYENAFTTAQRFLKIAPDDQELQRLSALASLYDNKIDEAVIEYQRILERNPNDKEALVNLALAHGRKLRVDDEAASYYERALELQPNNDLLHLAKARLFLSRNDAVQAVDCYKKALKVKDGNEQNVLAHLANVLTEHPEILRLRWFNVEILVSHGHLREALDQLEFITQNHPGQTQNILRALETILAKDPNNLTALLQRGSILLSMNQPEDAVKMLEKAYTLKPTEAAVLERLAAAYNMVIEKKDLPEMRFKLGRLYFSQQEYDHAIGCFQKTAQDYRWEAESTKMLGKCFTEKGMLDLALQEYKKLVVDSETKDLLYDLAQRYEAKKDLVGAKTVYRQLFAADIDYKDVKARFEMLSGSTSDPMAFEKTSIVQQMSEAAARRYELLDELGRGAMGIVYRARDKELEEIVALKILPDNMSNNPEAVRRFRIEARNARKLSHPNIVRIHDIGEEMGRKYISMEYVDGSDLKKKMKSAPDFKLPIPIIVNYAMQCADALAYAHRLGIVHRDIKPANIMLTSTDDVKVTDFGIAKMMDQVGVEGTMIGAVIGTPLYMSPEQVQGIPVDNRADIYAFGIMLYELFSGRPPFTEGDLAYQHIHKDPTPIPGLPDDLWAILAKCLAKKKEDRWDTAELVYEALRDFKKAAV